MNPTITTLVLAVGDLGFAAAMIASWRVARLAEQSHRMALADMHACLERLHGKHDVARHTLGAALERLPKQRAKRAPRAPKAVA